MQTSVHAAERAGRGFTICAAVFLAAAGAVALARAATPFHKGWWLVAYLSLVGGVAQLLLGPGLIALSRKRAAPLPGGRARALRLGLWNVGALAVAVSDLAEAMWGVAGGSLLLLAALALFAADLRPVRALGGGGMGGVGARWWARGYALLLVFLAASVAVGMALAYRAIVGAG